LLLRTHLDKGAKIHVTETRMPLLQKPGGDRLRGCSDNIG
jgi:hypothetical protein